MYFFLLLFGILFHMDWWRENEKEEDKKSLNNAAQGGVGCGNRRSGKGKRGLIFYIMGHN
jgi:hypothetical protein